MATSDHTIVPHRLPRSPRESVEIEPLKSVAMFSSLKPRHLEKIAKISKIFSLSSEKTLFSEGDEGGAAYVLIKGDVRILKNEIKVAQLKSGEVIGEMSAFDNKRRSGSIITNSDSKFLEIPSSDFKNLILKHKEIRAAVLKNLTQRVRQCNILTQGKINGNITPHVSLFKSVKDSDKYDLSEKLNVSELSQDVRVIFQMLQCETLPNENELEKVVEDILKSFPLNTLMKRSPNDLSVIFYASALSDKLNEYYEGLKFWCKVDELFPKAIIIHSLRTKVTNKSLKIDEIDNHEIKNILERLKYINNCPIFANISIEEMISIAQIAQFWEESAGKTIVEKGGPGDSMYIITSGEVEILVGERTVPRKEGDFFGDMSLLDQEPRSASVVAKTNVSGLKISEQHFTPLLDHSDVLFGVLQELARRIRESNEILTSQ